MYDTDHTTDDAPAQDRAAQLEATLDALWENRCEACSRPRHPRSLACDGCALDALRSGT